MNQQKGGGVIDKLLLPLGLIGIRKLVYLKKTFNKKNKTKKNNKKNRKKSKKYRKK